jgi:hypothetical protein
MGSCITRLRGPPGGGQPKPRADRYKQDDPDKEVPKNQPTLKASGQLEKKKFSWDDKKKNFNPDDYQFKNEEGKLLYKGPGTLKG